MELSTQPAIKLLLRTPRNAKTLNVKTENLKLYGDYVTSFDLLLYIQTSLIYFQK